MTRRPIRFGGWFRTVRIFSLSVFFVFSLLTAFAPDVFGAFGDEPAPAPVQHPATRLPNSIVPLAPAHARTTRV